MQCWRPLWQYKGRKGHGGISHTCSPNSEVPAHQSILGGETEVWLTGIPEMEGTLTLPTDEKTRNLRRNLRKEYGSTQPSQPTRVLLVTIPWPNVTGSSQASLWTATASSAVHTWTLQGPGMPWLKGEQFDFSLVQLKQDGIFPKALCWKVKGKQSQK